MTLNEAKQLKYGETVHHKRAKNKDGTPVRFRISGAVKTWKRDPERIRIPFKWGMYESGYLVNGMTESGKVNIPIEDIEKG